MTLQDQLKKLNACEEAQEWAAQFTTLREAWDACYRGDWMLWIYAILRPNNLRELTLAKGHCANTVRRLMKDERSIRAVDTAIAFGEGRVSLEELREAAAAAAAAYAYAAAAAADADVDADAYAVAYAAYAYAAAADDDADAYAYAAAADDYAAYAAADAYAAYAAAYAAANYDAAKKENQQLTADICRRYLTGKMFGI